MRFTSAMIRGLLLCGCGAPQQQTIQRDGFVVVKKSFDQAERDVTARASFELSCPAEQLTLRILADRVSDWDGESRVVQQLGVAGCGKSAVYVYTRGGGWIANTEQGTNGAGSAPPSSVPPASPAP